MTVRSRSVTSAEVPGPSRAGRRRRIARLAGKIAIAAAVVLAPPAAAVDAAVLAPGASVPGTIAGAHVTSRLSFSSGDIRTSFPLDIKFYQRSGVSIAGKRLGANVTFDYNETDLTDAEGRLAPQRIAVIAKDFTNSGAEVQAITRATAEYYGKVMLGSLVGVLLAEVAVGLYLVRRRRDGGVLSPVARAVIRADRRLPRTVGGVLVAAAVGGLAVPAAVALSRPSPVAPPRPDKTLADLGFTHISINQKGRQLVDSTVTTAERYFDSVDQYYDQLGDTFRDDFRRQLGTGSLAPAPGTYRIIAADDFQGQDGPAKIVGLAATMYNADLIVVGGDTTATGASFETFEFSSLRQYSGKIPILVSRGHHDPDLSTFRQMAETFDGIYIADGKPRVLGGIHVVGFNAPDIIPFGSGQDHVVHPAHAGETVQQANDRLAQQIITSVCRSTKPLVVELHDDSVGHQVARAGCKQVKIVLDGREYTAKPPTDYGPTAEFTSGSTGGHSAFEPPLQLFSKITAPASFREITIDAKTYEPISSTLVTLYPDGRVTFTNETVSEGAGAG